MEEKQGRPLNQTEIDAIRHLLENTQTPIPDIAATLECGKGDVLSINRRYGIRNLVVKRSGSKLGEDSGKDNAEES